MCSSDLSRLMLAQEYFAEWYSTASDFFDTFEFNMSKGSLNNAAFQLHQSVEHLYHTALLVKTLYTPHAHNIRYLRGEAAKLDRRFLSVWPEESHWQKAAFNQLKEAYVKGRYSKRYRIGADQLRWLGEQGQELARVVQAVCQEHIAELERIVAVMTSGRRPARRSRPGGRDREGP